MMITRAKATLAGALAGLAMLAFTASPLLAQTPPTGSGSVPTHEQMHEMMDAMHGAGTTERMHEVMGQGDAQRGEQLMDQCVAMMGMMQGMQGMMGNQNGQAMQRMMDGMMGSGSR